MTGATWTASAASVDTKTRYGSKTMSDDEPDLFDHPSEKEILRRYSSERLRRNELTPREYYERLLLQGFSKESATKLSGLSSGAPVLPSAPPPASEAPETCSSPRLPLPPQAEHFPQSRSAPAEDQES